MDLNEPKLTAEASIVLNTRTGGVEATQVKIDSPTLTATASRVGFEPRPSGEPALDAKGTIDADLNGLQRLLGLALDPKGGDALSGRVSGPFEASTAATKTRFQTALVVTDFALGPKGAPGLPSR